MPAVTVSVIAGSGGYGFTDGPAAVARFCSPNDVAVAPDGSYFVADKDTRRVRRVAPDGTVSTVAGTGEYGSTDGPGEVATFNDLRGIAVDRRGSVFVTDWERVRKIARDGGGGWVVSTVVAAGLGMPWGIAVDPAGHLVVADMFQHRVVRVDPVTGDITLIAGDGTPGFRDGPGATARFNFPMGVAIDRHGNIFVADTDGHRVRRISAADRTVTTVAGSGVQGDADGAGTAAQFYYPRTVAVDGRGVLLVAVADGSFFRLRRVAASADRTVTTVVDGTAVGSMRPAFGSAIDHDGSLLLAARYSNCIFRVTGLGLAPPSAPAWSLRAHRGLAAAAPAVGRFVAMVMLCALRLDIHATSTHHRGQNAEAVLPRLPVEMWLAILSMLRPDQMLTAEICA